MDKNDLAIAVALTAATFTGWQAWTAHRERDTPLQALVYQTQLSAIQTIVDNARTSCRTALCETDVKTKYDVCTGSELENSFGKVEEGIEALKLTASTPLLETLSRLQKIHQRFALHANQETVDEPDYLKHLQRDADYKAIALVKKCNREIDQSVNEIRSQMGLGRLSADLLSRLGEGRAPPTNADARKQ